MTTTKSNCKRDTMIFNVVIVVFQMIVPLLFMKAKSSAEIVEGCIESQLTLTCSQSKVINVSSVVLGDSDCWRTSCCPRNDSCTANPNANHVRNVHSRCNGRQTCYVDVIKERIPCGTVSFYYENNDFERITYDCIDNGNMVEGCIESQLTLSCNETKVINISSVVLGDSTGCSGTNCCPTPNSCTRNPNANHVNQVHSRCNGRQTCSVDVIKERITCGYLYIYDHNDFERITYDCIDNRRYTTDVLSPTTKHVTLYAEQTETPGFTSQHSRTQATEFGLSPQSKNLRSQDFLVTNDKTTETERETTSTVSIFQRERTTKDEREMGSIDSIWQKEAISTIPIVMTCLVVVVVIIIILVITIFKRKKSQIQENLRPVKDSDVIRCGNEKAYAKIADDGETYEAIANSNTDTETGNRTYEKVVKPDEEIQSDNRSCEKIAKPCTEYCNNQPHDQLNTETSNPTYLQLI